MFNPPKSLSFFILNYLFIIRWTTLVHQFAPQKFKKGRLFDSIVPNENEQAENSYNDIDLDSKYGKG